MRDYGRMSDGRKPGIDARVMGSNPCLTGDMQLLTENGYKSMLELWESGGSQIYSDSPTLYKFGELKIINRNGIVSATNVYKTSLDSEIYRVYLSNGKYIDATSGHAFIVADISSEYRLKLNELKVGMAIPIYNSQEKFASIVNILYIGKQSTYCLTEPGSHEICVNDCIIGQCSEQSLESEELCNLCETFPAKHADASDYMRTLKFAYLYAKTVTLLPTHNARTNQVMLRNRRIGLSQSGIAQAFAKFGRRRMLMDFCDAGYNEINRWDDKYSEWLCVQRSIKKTSIKPSGSVSLLSGSTPGIHYPEASTYWRRVRVSKDSAIVKVLQDAGYHIEPSITDPNNTVVVKFAITDETVESVDKIGIWQQVANVVDYQRYWADNQVSCTIKFKQNETAEISKVLETYEDQLKSISFLPQTGHGYAQAPYEQCSPEEVNKYNSIISDVDYSPYVHEALGSKYCDADKCEI